MLQAVYFEGMAKSSPLIDFHTSNGAVFTERDGWLLPAHFGNPTDEYAAVRSTVGCGDAALAGFAVAHARGLGDEEALCLAVACGAANCLAESPGLIDRLDVDRILQQVSAEPLQMDWRELKTQGGAR